MLAIIKAIFILLLEIIIFYIFGTISDKVLMRGRESRVSERVIVGFLLLQIMFQICSFPFIYFDTSLTLLTLVWTIFLGGVLFVGVLITRKELLKGVKGIADYIKERKWIVGVLFLAVMAMCYYVSINGERNEDSMYYIGLINTSLSMDSMYRFNVYNGFGMESLYARRALVTFDIHSAVLCKIFNVHPLILVRYGRASLNVVLTAMATYLVGTMLYRKESAALAEKKACALVIVVFIVNFLFAGIYIRMRCFYLQEHMRGNHLPVTC